MAKQFAFLLITFIIISLVNSEKALKFYEEKDFHEALDLTDEDFVKLGALTDSAHFRSMLDKILVPRVVGSKNHQKVGNFIRDELKRLDWDVKEDVFPDKTPVFGVLNFRNIIATLNPDAERYLVLSCHYDSKYTREHVFVGATDSAVPCAMLLNLAKTMVTLLEPLKKTRLSLMFIFFDGEEAFRQWGPTDSIYGSRHLARMWHKTPFKNGANHLQRIDMLVLLDLLGAPDPVFHSYFRSTEKWYVRLAAAEQKLAELNLLSGYSTGKPEQTYFRLSSSGAFIDDDHTPFMQRDVNILHVIPTPFPRVWHTADDNINALDFNTIENLNKIFRIFVAEYFHIKP